MNKYSSFSITPDLDTIARAYFKKPITISFEIGKQNRMIISKDAIRAMGDPRYVQVLINPKHMTLLVMGTKYESPDCIQVRGAGKMPINRCRQELITRLIELAGWKNGHRYTIEARTLPIGKDPALCFDLKKAAVTIPSRKPA